jgi:hypothetical protein
MHHPVAVTSHDPQLVRRIRSYHPLPFELFSDFLKKSEGVTSCSVIIT